MSEESLLEVEFKYLTNGISLGDFLKVVVGGYDRIHNIHIISVSGTDYFFKTKSSDQEFIRYRVEKDKKYAELTHKKKLNKNNSFKREEIDLPITAHKNAPIPSLSHIQSLVKNFGFELCGVIDKTNFIVKLERFIYAYYVINNKDYYIEVEARKDVFTDDKEAFNQLEQEEKFCLSKLGLSKKDRVKESLFELYKDKP